MLKNALFLFLAVFLFQWSALYSEGAEHNPYLLLTIPKSGTHLIAKLIEKITGEPIFGLANILPYASDASQFFPPIKEEEVQVILQFMEGGPNQSIVSHFNLATYLEPYAQSGYAKMIFVRDLRDVCVSLVHFIHEHLDIVLGKSASFDQRLAFVIRGVHWSLNRSIFNVKLEAQAAIQWMQDPEVLVLRFEDLCGERGGGSLDAQLECIRKVAQHLDIALSEAQLALLPEEIWGNTVTFRKGEIGSWKSCFNKANKRLFKTVLGEELIRLGYESDYNW